MTLVVSSTYKFKLGLQMLEKQLPYLMRIQMVKWKFLRLKTKFLTPIQLYIHKRIKVCDHFFYFLKLLFCQAFYFFKGIIFLLVSIHIVFMGNLLLAKQEKQASDFQLKLSKELLSRSYRGFPQ